MTEIYIDWLATGIRGGKKGQKVTIENACLYERKRKYKEAFRIFESWMLKKQMNLCSS